MKFLLTVLLVGAIVSLGLPIGHAGQESEISEVTLEMTRGMNSKGEKYGGAFKITLRRDGTALFTGKAKVKLIGNYEGVISQSEFEALARELESHNYSEIKGNQLNTVRLRGGSITVNAMITPLVTTVIKHGSKQKKIERASNETAPENENRDSIGRVPTELFEIEKAITDASMRVKWKKVEN